MEQSLKNNTLTPRLFFLAGLLLLIFGMICGVTGALQYIFPGLFKDTLSFEKIRPLHVSSVVFWIILGATGGVLTYVQQHTGKRLFSVRLLKLQFFTFSATIFIILAGYFMGYFGGREYWEFPPLLALPILFSWILLLVNFIRSVGSFRNQPVYVWMWLTGIVFFLFTYLESYLWIFPFFSHNVVKDMTIQWKSYGSMVGSWNMMIYGCSLFLMDKISQNKQHSYSGMAFFLYFTGLFNLLFNWGHHIYTLPTHALVKNISYSVSMTELFILGRIIFLWKNSLSTAVKHFSILSYRFLVAADIWIFLTLLLAILMSVPGINIFTHGTHITVAHTMGATIGINSFLLFAIAFDILKDSCRSFVPYEKIISVAWGVSNYSLLIFWLSLVVAGIFKAIWQMSQSQVLFRDMMDQLQPFFIFFVVAGTILMIGLMIIIYPLLATLFSCYVKQVYNKKSKDELLSKDINLLLQD
jgi:nitric oxide reductase subunit B